MCKTKIHWKQLREELKMKKVWTPYWLLYCLSFHFVKKISQFRKVLLLLLFDFDSQHKQWIFQVQPSKKSHRWEGILSYNRKISQNSTRSVWNERSKLINQSLFSYSQNEKSYRYIEKRFKTLDYCQRKNLLIFSGSVLLLIFVFSLLFHSMSRSGWSWIKSWARS